MKGLSAFLLIAIMMAFSTYTSAQEMDSLITETSYAELSMILLQNVRDGNPTQKIEDKLATVSREELNSDLDTESEKKAFWLNVYNAYVQILLTEKPELFKDRNSFFGYNFFSSPQVTIAGKKLSFDDIEHGIIRHSKIKLALGYLDKWFPNDYEVMFRWGEVDPRVHLALNCGAKSCPYIAIYDPERVEEQLDIISKQYLEKTTVYDADKDKVKVNTLMSWFRGDFGGKAGAVEMLKKYNVIPQDADPSVSFLEYDWTLELGNYTDI
tara:strand:+ start:992 stop:1795 length:804 start_codon:yes stop_codon:yes gene_type:complete